MGWALGLTLGITALPLPAEDLHLRLRIAWGGAERTTWTGSISVSQGQLADLVPLGIESDEPGSVWLERNVVRIEQGTRRDYSGIDVSVTAPQDARLVVRLGSGVAQREVITETDLAKLIGSEHRAALDVSGNYLLVTRAPGDRLRVRVDREHVIYAPGETVVLRMEPSPEVVANQDSLQLVAEVARGRGGEVLHTQYSNLTREELRARALRVALPAPREEGVYEARLLLRRPPNISQRIVPIAGAGAIVERRVQFVVFDRGAVRLTPPFHWEEVAAIDLASPNWATRIPARISNLTGLQKLPGVPQRPLASAAPTTAEIAGRTAFVLPRPTAPGEKVWYAVPITIETPNTPYLLSVDVPENHVSQLGVSILEPNAAGYVYPVTRDFGLYSAGVASGGADAWITKQFIFWPRSAAPMLLLTNEHPDEPAHVGTVRLSRARLGESGIVESLPSPNHRIAAVLVDRPWLVESLGGREAFDAANNQSIDDWQTFYDAATRLVDYVQLSGYNAAVLSAFADGSTIYPSDLLQSTPRYDTGVLASTAQDPLRKDFIELLLAAFDRAGLHLYIALEFSTPLPELEQLRRSEDSQRSGIEWVGADGQTWSKRHRPTGGAAPHYNLLNERVQEALLRVVRELASRYESHASLRGIALQLAGNGYGQLLGLQWGLDDDTIARFTTDTGIHVPGSGPNRFAERERFLREDKRKEWIAWRARVATAFYKRLTDVVRDGSEQRELLLLCERLVERQEIRARLRPSLAAPESLTQLLFELGLHMESLAKIKGLVLLRPTFATPLAPLGAFAAENQVNASTDLDAMLAKADVLGEVVYFPNLTRNRRILSFDQLHPFGENKSFTAPLTQMRPLGNLRTRAIARALAGRDPAIFVEGGPTLVTELDEDLRRALEIMRKLPTGDCKKAADRRHQPITVWTYQTEADSYVCVINESPWPQRVDVILEAPPGTQLLEIGSVRAPQTVPMDPARIPLGVDLSGYGVYAVRISSPAARVTSVGLAPSSTMRAELARRVDELSQRATQIKSDRPILVVPNSGFENIAGDAEISGWQVFNPQGGQVELDAAHPQEGSHSLRITSSGPAVSVISQTFAPPATGRLAVSAYMRRSPQSPDVAVTVVIEDAQGHARAVFRPIGPAGANNVPLHAEWGGMPYRFAPDETSIDGQTPLRIRFEVVGEGTVWIDNVQVSDESLVNQQRELNMMIYEAQVALKNQAYSDCLQSLDGFWPRYLAARVAVPSTAERVPQTTAEPPSANEATAREKQGVADRIKQYVPKILQYQ